MSAAAAYRRKLRVRAMRIGANTLGVLLRGIVTSLVTLNALLVAGCASGPSAYNMAPGVQTVGGALSVQTSEPWYRLGNGAHTELWLKRPEDGALAVVLVGGLPAGEPLFLRRDRVAVWEAGMPAAAVVALVTSSHMSADRPHGVAASSLRPAIFVGGTGFAFEATVTSANGQAAHLLGRGAERGSRLFLVYALAPDRSVLDGWRSAIDEILNSALAR